jgi:hypothetical protein
MHYSSTKRWTNSVLRSNDRSPYYSASKHRDPKAAPYIPPPVFEGKHDVPRSTNALGEPLHEPTYNGMNIGTVDEVGQTRYLSKNGPGDRGVDSVSSALRNRDTCQNSSEKIGANK